MMKTVNTFRKVWLLFLIVGNCLVLSAMNQEGGREFFSASDSRIAYMGRVSTSVKEVVRFTYPGVSIWTDFEGTSLQMCVNPNSGSYMIEIDDELPYRIDVGKSDSILILAEGLSAGKHRAKIMYLLEGQGLKPEFKGFYLDDGCKLLDKSQLPERRIEFIGNSITCGFGIEDTNPEAEFTYDTENFWFIRHFA